MMLTVFFAGAASGAVEKWGDTGTVIAVTESSRTIVVEIPRGGDEKLTVGAELASDAVLRAGEKAIGLSDIHTGDRVRLEWSCGEQGCTAHKIVVLQPAR